MHRKTLSVYLLQQLKFLYLIHKITFIHIGSPFIKAQVKSVDYVHDINLGTNS